MNKVILVGVTHCLLWASVWVQSDSYDSGGPLLPEQAAYDVTFYELNLVIDPHAQTIAGSNNVTARAVTPLSFLVLDFEERYTIDSIFVTNQDELVRSTYERKGTKIWIDLLTDCAIDSFVTAQIFYHGQPRVAPNPPWSGGFTWATTAAGEPWVSSSCQNNGADIWWPCKDHPSDEPDSMALSFTVPKNLTCVSNGKLRRITDNPDNSRTFYWFVSTPINNYAVSFYIAPYVMEEFFYKSYSGEKMPMAFYFLPEHRERFREFAPQIPQHVRFLEELLGPYPFRMDKYAVVEAPYLGMEHQTCIAYGNTSGNAVFGYDQGFDALHFHELAHEWWGNMITAADWKDFWLHEGFATYMEALYAGHLNGQVGYDAVMQHFAGRISNSRPVAPKESQTTNQIYGGDIYFKGAWVLHTLRYLIGDELFFQSLLSFLYPDPSLKTAKDGEQCRLVSTDEFIETVEQVSNRELDWFFQVYLRQAQPPVLQTWIKDQYVHLAWSIENKVNFPLNVPVQIGDSIKIADMSTGQTALKLVPFVAPQIDPENRIYKRIDRVTDIENTDQEPQDFVLVQNFPNPFNNSTTIEFHLPKSATILLTIHNVRGELVETLAQGDYEAGVFRLEWETTLAPSGTYTYKLLSGDFVDTKKMTVLK